MEKEPILAREASLCSVSLLWPEGKREKNDIAAFAIGEDLKRDLELEILFRKIAGSDRQYLEIAPILLAPSTDPAVIAYRQDVMEDLLGNAALRRCCVEILPGLSTLTHSRHINTHAQNALYVITSRLSELESYLHCVTKLAAAFEACPRPLVSAGWKRLRETALALSREETFRRLAAELPDLLSRLRGIRSVTIGVNLDLNLLPCAATLIEVNKERFTEKSGNLLARLFGDHHSAGESIAELHSVPKKELSTIHGNIQVDPDTFGAAFNPLLIPLFNDLNNVLRKISVPVGRALHRYLSVNTTLIGDLRPEIVFYLGACDLSDGLKAAGLPLTRPVMSPAGERMCRVRNGYNLNLALTLLAGGRTDVDAAIVKNDFRFDDGGRVIILTGPNRGGKTTYLQAIGLCHILAQLGLPVPGEEAVMSPVDNIFTHFPVEEKIDSGTGRLGDEAKRIDEIFERLTPESLLLLNETFSSTSAGESCYIARDIVRVLLDLGARCIYSTHLHELASAIGEINRESGHEKALSLVATTDEWESDDGRKEMRRTYKIVAGPPVGRSYAREIAERYGVSYNQLIQKLKDRGLSGRPGIRGSADHS